MEQQIMHILGEIQGQIGCIQSDITVMKNDIQNLKTDVQELKSDMTNMKSDIKDLQMNQSHFDNELRSVHILIENNIMHKIDLLYENRDVIISRIDKIDRMNKTEEDIALLKIAVSANSRDIKELQKRQLI